MARISKDMTSVYLAGERDERMMRFLQVRNELPRALAEGKYPIRVDMTWSYEGDKSGMPSDDVTEQMGTLEEALIPALEKNNLALLAYQLTGEGERLWCFYTRNLPAFQETLNEALSELPLFPLAFYAEEDREGEAFSEVIPFINKENEV
ncbi:DUF695 domain-containing protein [Porphyromonas levii]|uniref:DUF695 domain-containing protein n=1 Tax=Porphyromonas levii TaxID=28114 RepID=A0A4Y8WRZ8_9PORP|nr:DUF695 domain-containing protein [Porphyromonas levii]MBR8712355.1 hypothetical protein [Porphyromonas levii]MBR8714178.1 hypothetical protein [Porphyromonas levii]MBR8726720.1 hypothetical protein [Porphyromonas levii]MBR8730832.1 hypothetical protein [Porphyromonas levii]MBR8735025.1 hypothetical protein [Porphyromonas levii]